MTRLSKSDWVEFGLKQLTEFGHEALSASSLAGKLNVPRGSFYSHFKDIAEFESDVLELWQDQTTERTIRGLKIKSKPEQKFRLLIDHSLMAPDLERSIRVWSISNTRAAQTVADVDARRFEYLKALLGEIGVGKSETGYRGLVLYWASIGQTVIANTKVNSLNDTEKDKLFEFITGSSKTKIKGG